MNFSFTLRSKSWALRLLDVSGEDLGLVLADSAVPIAHHLSVLVVGDCAVSNAAGARLGCVSFPNDREPHSCIEFSASRRLDEPGK